MMFLPTVFAGLLQAAIADPVSVAATTIATSGILGSVCVIMAVVIAFLWRDAKQERSELQARLAEAQALRISDSLAVQDRMLRVVEQATTVITSVSASQAEMRVALDGVRDALTEHTNELKMLVDRVNPRR